MTRHVQCVVCGRFVHKVRWGIPVCRECEDIPERYHVGLMDPMTSAWRITAMFAGGYGDDGEFHG